MRFLTFILSFAACFFGASCREQINQADGQKMSNNKTVTANQAANNSTPSTSNSIPVYSYDVVNTFKHDSKAFTQGLFFYNGLMYESVGREGKSDLRRVKLENGDVEKRRKVDSDYFAEGATILNGKIFQLTWQSNICFVYDANSFEPIERLNYNGEGWGLTNDGTNLIMTDGSHQIKFVDPANFRVLRTVNVFNNGKPQIHLNELEYVKGELWANIWHSEDPNILGNANYIARIDPKDGKILGWIDLGGISPDDANRDPENTLNGIAYDAATDRIFVTGKQWKKLFEIKLKLKA
ncbi:MAG: glutaminyl-peptide cyclotransferase [Pyrinomonadaceae bacterium]|nr:glutaminyl-peptide cyclotransferase [Pyrinomonadaceae bacterium]